MTEKMSEFSAQCMDSRLIFFILIDKNLNVKAKFDHLRVSVIPDAQTWSCKNSHSRCKISSPQRTIESLLEEEKS